jgi:hypothetical protein
LRSFSHSDPLFSITSALFLQNTRGGIPPRDIVRCTEAQKRLSISPLLATLTHSVSRKSFPCHSYANTGDGGATQFSFQPRRLCGLCASVANRGLPRPGRRPSRPRSSPCLVPRLSPVRIQ